MKELQILMFENRWTGVQVQVDRAGDKVDRRREAAANEA